jgi:hypothetical protein
MYEGFGQTNSPNFAAVCIPSILKTRAAYSSETRIRIYQTTRLHVPEDNNPHIQLSKDHNLETLQMHLLTDGFVLQLQDINLLEPQNTPSQRRLPMYSSWSHVLC